MAFQQCSSTSSNSSLSLYDIVLSNVLSPMEAGAHNISVDAALLYKLICTVDRQVSVSEARQSGVIHQADVDR